MRGGAVAESGVLHARAGNGRYCSQRRRRTLVRARARARAWVRGGASPS